MAKPDDFDELDADRLCFNCIGEQYLKDVVRHSGRTAKCSYCNENAQSFTIRQLAKRVEDAFKQHYTRTSDLPDAWQEHLNSDRDSEYDWVREGELVECAIMNAADIPERAAIDIRNILEEKHRDFEAEKLGMETEFCQGSYYDINGPDDFVWQEEWRIFERSLKTEARFFSKTAASHLASIFSGIDKKSAADGRPLVVDVGPHTEITSIYRARVFQSEEKLKEALCRPDRFLGPPPAALASAGRMNAQGISVFYGAIDSDTAVAEVRPPVGSRVTVACFAIVRPLRLLDLPAFSSVIDIGSVFDPGWADRLSHVTFLRSLSQHLTKPVMPNDEAFEYIPTQAIADFLATENEPLLDGIVFPSTQTEGDSLNIVLFHKAARIEEIDIPEGTKIEAIPSYMVGDEPGIDYFVYEHVSPEHSFNTKDPDIDFQDPKNLSSVDWELGDVDLRKVTLCIDTESVKVHYVHSVRFTCQVNSVRKFRYDED